MWWRVPGERGDEYELRPCSGEQTSQDQARRGLWVCVCVWGGGGVRGGGGGMQEDQPSTCKRPGERCGVRGGRGFEGWAQSGGFEGGERGGGRRRQDGGRGESAGGGGGGRGWEYMV